MKRTICPKCKRPLRHANAWHYCEQVEIDDLFINKSDDIILTFYKILEEVATWEDVAVSASKNCVIFLRNKSFLIIKPMTKCLEVKFYNNETIEDDELHKCQQWNSKFLGIARFKHEDEVKEKFFKYFRKSYLIS